MSRFHFRPTIRDQLGRAVALAKVEVFEKGTTTPVADMWDSETGGTSISILTSSATQGEIEAWFDTARQVDLRISDNATLAYPIAAPATRYSPFTFTETLTIDPALRAVQRAGQVVQASGTGLKWSYGIEWLDARDGNGLGGNTADFTDPSADVTAAINATVARVPLGASGDILIPGPGTISSTILIDQRPGLTVKGMGWRKSILTPAPALAGLTMIRFQSYDKSGIRDLHINGNSSAPPLYGVEFREDNNNNPLAVVPTAGFVNNVRFGSTAANSMVNPIGFTTAGLDENNDLSVIRDIQAYNYSGAAVKIGHSNSLLHRIIGGSINGAVGIQLSGGSFNIVGLHFATTSWMIDFGAGDYRHRSLAYGITSEGSGPWLRSNVGAITACGLSAVGCEFTQGSNGLTVIDWKSPGSWLSLIGGIADPSAPATVADFGTSTTTDVRIVGVRRGIGQIIWNGKLTLSANSDQTGGVTLTPGTSAKLVRFADNTGGGQFQTLDFGNGDGSTYRTVSLFMDTSDGKMKVTDISGTRQV